MHKRKESAAPTSPSEPKRSLAYRRAIPLPYELLQDVKTPLEEGLYAQGFSLLKSTLRSGGGSWGPTDPDAGPSYIPPPAYLGLAATLASHPRLTTRTTSKEDQAAADEALSYLCSVSRIVGARNAEFAQAFTFRSRKSRDGRARLKGRSSLVAEDGDMEEEDPIRSKYANEEALWSWAEDFWKVVGWGLNCSVKYPERWERWARWLKVMLEILEDDLESRAHWEESQRGDNPFITKKKRAGDDAEGERVDPNDACVQGSLIAHFLSYVEGSTQQRKMMRAIFADGRKESLGEFKEIWPNETKPLKKKQDPYPSNKRRKVDLEDDEFADSDVDLMDDTPADSSPRKSRAAPTRPRIGQRGSRPTFEDDNSSNDEEMDQPENDDGEGPHGLEHPNDLPSIEEESAPRTIADYGGMDALKIRQRLLCLLTRFSSLLPSHSEIFIDNEALFELVVDNLRSPLGLSIYQKFVLPSTIYLPSELSQQKLNMTLLRPLLAGVPRYLDSINNLTQEQFEVHFAPFVANKSTAIDNAKVSLLVEGLLRFLGLEGRLTTGSSASTTALSPTTRRQSKLENTSFDSLETALKKGIAARKAKSGKGGKSKSKRSSMPADKDEIEGRAILDSSSKTIEMRLVML